jgi:hypothetical protein
MAKAKTELLPEEKMPPTEEPGMSADAVAFVMPEVEIGDIVEFRYLANDTPSPAHVISIYRNSLDLAIVKANGAAVFREAVRHVDDPDLKTNPTVRKQGMWKHTQRTQKLIELLKLFPPEEDAKQEESLLPAE